MKPSHFRSPADSKAYNTVKSRGEPKLHPSGHAPADHEKSYPAVKSSGEPPTAHGGVDIAKRHGAKPNLSNRRG